MCGGSCGSALRVLLLHLEVANFEPEMRECTSRIVFVLKNCDFAFGALDALRVLFLYLEVANFEPELQECAYTCVSKR